MGQCMDGNHRSESPLEGSCLDGSLVVRELDRLLDQDRGQEAADWLCRCLSESRQREDWQTELTVLNEMMGFYRNQGDREKGLLAVEEGIRLLGTRGIRESVTAGTTLLNAATTMKAFGKTKESLPYYEEAERLYGRFLPAGDYRLAGFYNNYALALMETGDFRRSEECFQRAMSIMEGLPESTLEIGVTLVNLATLYDSWQQGEERVRDCLLRAWDCFEDPGVRRNAYYAFNCRKCAGTFGYYGFFFMEEELRMRAEEIYQRNRKEQDRRGHEDE